MRAAVGAAPNAMQLRPCEHESILCKSRRWGHHLKAQVERSIAVETDQIARHPVVHTVRAADVNPILTVQRQDVALATQHHADLPVAADLVAAGAVGQGRSRRP